MSFISITVSSNLYKIRKRNLRRVMYTQQISYYSGYDYLIYISTTRPSTKVCRLVSDKPTHFSFRRNNHVRKFSYVNCVGSAILHLEHRTSSVYILLIHPALSRHIKL